MIFGLLDHLRARGVTIEAVGDRLRYRGPREALSREVIETLRAHKADILRLLSLPPADPDSDGAGPAGRLGGGVLRTGGGAWVAGDALQACPRRRFRPDSVATVYGGGVHPRSAARARCAPRARWDDSPTAETGRECAPEWRVGRCRLIASGAQPQGPARSEHPGDRETDNPPPSARCGGDPRSAGGGRATAKGGAKRWEGYRNA